MSFNEILSFYEIQKQYSEPIELNTLCYVCSGTDIPMTDFTQEGDNENE